MEILETLQNVGLGQKEASVYLALLELGTADVGDIAKKAEIKRPTAYLILDDLKKKGLVTIVPKAKVILYTAESPEKLMQDLQKKQELVKRYLPNLLALHNAKINKPQVLLFEGREGVGKVYDKIFSSSEVLFFSTIRDVFKLFPDMPKILMKRVEARLTKFREILTQTPTDMEYVSWVKQGEYYQSRFAPKDFPEFLTDSAIFGNNVAFFSFKPTIFAVQINSKEINQSLKVLYELAWVSGESYEKVMNDSGKTVLV